MSSEFDRHTSAQGNGIFSRSLSHWRLGDSDPTKCGELGASMILLR